MMNRSEKSDKDTIVYVGGLESDVTKEDLENEFGKFGTLNRVWVAFNPPGFAFVEYDNKEDAEAAVKTLHDETVLGSKLRVEISRGRPRGGRGGGGRGGDRGGRGSFRGGRGDFHSDFRGGRGDFRGGRGTFPGRGDFQDDFGGGRGRDLNRGRGLLRGRGGFGGGRPFDQDDDFKPFRGGGMGGRFDDFEERNISEFAQRDFGGPREFGARRNPPGARDFGELNPRGFEDNREFAPREGGRDFAARDMGGREFATRDVGGRDFPGRDYPSRDVMVHDYADSRDVRSGRDFAARDYGDERGMNGTRAYGGGPVERGYNGGPTRDYGGVQSVRGGRGFGAPRDIPPVRDAGAGRDYGGVRDIGMRREAAIRDFNPPRDLGDPRDFGTRPSRLDYENERFSAGGRGGGFGGGRYPVGDVGGTGDYGGGYGARDRFRSRSPIGRVSRPLY